VGYAELPLPDVVESDPVRIAIIATPWAPIPPSLYGGIEQAIDAEARGMAAAGHEVLLFTTGDSSCPVPRQWLLPEAEGERMGVAVPEVRHVLAAYEAVADFDVVHDHTIVGPAMASQGGIGGGAPPVVTTIHGPLDGELAEIYRRIGDSVGLIAISHAQTRPAPDVTIARVIHHGVTASEFPLGDGKGDYFVFLGRLSADKGAHRAIAAAEKAGVTLILAGKVRERAEKEYFEQEVAPHLSDEIRFVGEVPHDEKLRLLAGARATLFPIRWNEPFGLVMIESLACGTPVVAFPEGAAPEVIVDGSTGFLVNSEGEMADAIASVGEIDRNACRAAIEGYFSVDRMVREHLELFEDVVAGRVAETGQVAGQDPGSIGGRSSGGSSGDGDGDAAGVGVDGVRGGSTLQS
jgi:glycosyltransferase involved in cell wall biosynthesis